MTVFALLSLCLLVSAKDAAEWGRAKKAFKKANAKGNLTLSSFVNKLLKGKLDKSGGIV